MYQSKKLKFVTQVQARLSPEERQEINNTQVQNILKMKQEGTFDVNAKSVQKFLERVLMADDAELFDKLSLDLSDITQFYKQIQGSKSQQMDSSLRQSDKEGSSLSQSTARMTIYYNFVMHATFYGSVNILRRLVERYAAGVETRREVVNQLLFEPV